MKECSETVLLHVSFIGIFFYMFTKNLKTRLKRTRKIVYLSRGFSKYSVYDICRLQTADCIRQQDCKLNETKSIIIKVASSSTLLCSEKHM